MFVFSLHKYTKNTHNSALIFCVHQLNLAYYVSLVLYFEKRFIIDGKKKSFWSYKIHQKYKQQLSQIEILVDHKIFCT